MCTCLEYCVDVNLIGRQSGNIDASYRISAQLALSLFQLVQPRVCACRSRALHSILPQYNSSNKHGGISIVYWLERVENYQFSSIQPRVLENEAETCITNSGESPTNLCYNKTVWAGSRYSNLSLTCGLCS